MMKYQVTITETLSRTVEVEASSSELAEKKVRGLYREEVIVLSSSDFCFFNVDVCGGEAQPFFQTKGSDLV